MLVIDAVEISTTGGHLVVLGLESPAPYPLAGKPQDVIEDIHRLGGRAVLAHPDSPRDELAWRTGNAPYDGFEWMNADSEWRDDAPGRLLGAALRGLVRGPEAVADLFSRSERAFSWWDARPEGGRSLRPFGVAALDAHARIGWDDEREEPRQWTFLAKPSYEQMFRTIAQAVELAAPPGGRAEEDARLVLAAITGGRSYSIVRAIAEPATLGFVAHAAGTTVPMGGTLPPGPARFDVAVTEAPDASLRLLRNGRMIAEGHGTLAADLSAEPGQVFRVEATIGERSFPWLVSNPIFVGSPDAGPGPRDRPEQSGVPPERLEPFASFADWRIEREPSSSASMSVDESAMSLRWQFRLGPGRPAGQFAALSVPIASEHGYESIEFEARASRPLRMWFQVRLPGASDAQRWGRSIYVDELPRHVVVRLEDLDPIGRTSTLRPVVARIRSLLFVIDTVNTAPGSAGEIVLSNVALGLGDTGGGR